MFEMFEVFEEKEIGEFFGDNVDIGINLLFFLDLQDQLEVVNFKGILVEKVCVKFEVIKNNDLDKIKVLEFVNECSRKVLKLDSIYEY